MFLGSFMFSDSGDDEDYRLNIFHGLFIWKTSKSPSLMFHKNWNEFFYPASRNWGGSVQPSSNAGGRVKRVRGREEVGEFVNNKKVKQSRKNRNHCRLFSNFWVTKKSLKCFLVRSMARLCSEISKGLFHAKFRFNFLFWEKNESVFNV